MTDVCSSCRAPITWAVTAGGHRMPINPELTLDGNLRLTPVNGRGTPRVTVVTRADRVDGELLYKAHFATCPNANQHRRRTR